MQQQKDLGEILQSRKDGQNKQEQARIAQLLAEQGNSLQSLQIQHDALERRFERCVRVEVFISSQKRLCRIDDGGVH